MSRFDNSVINSSFQPTNIRSSLLRNNNRPFNDNLNNKSLKHSLITSSYTESIQNTIKNHGIRRKLPHNEKMRVAILQAIKDSSHPELKRKNIFDIVANYTARFQTVSPENTYLIIWHALILVIILYYLFETGLLLGFGRPVWKDILSYLIPVNIIFVICLSFDCALSFLKGYYEKGLLVANHRLIAKKYMPFYLCLDLIAIISVTLPFATDSYVLNWIKLLFLPKLITLFNIDKQFIRITQLSIKIHTFYLLSRLILLLILGSHYLGIFFYMVDYYVYETNYYGPNTPNLCWIYNAQAYSQMVLILPWYGQYEYAMYFSIGTMTTIAYGDITPLNPLQTLYITFALLLYTICFAYILSEILRILMEAQASKFQHTNTLLIVTNMMRDKMIPEKVQIQVRKFYEQMWKEEVYRNRTIEKLLIQRLPQKVRNELYSELYQNMFISMGIWNPLQHVNTQENIPQKDLIKIIQGLKIESEFVVMLANSINQERLVQGHYLYRERQKFTIENEQSHSYYFIKNIYKIKTIKTQKNKECIEIGINPTSNTSSDIKVSGMATGNIGIQSFYTGDIRSHYAKVISSSLVYKLPRKILLEALSVTTQQERQNLTMLAQNVNKLYCYICEVRNQHPFTKCPYATYWPNIYDIILKNISRQRKNRKQNHDVRRKRHKSNTLTHALEIKQNKYRIRNKYQMLMSNPYYSKLITSPMSSRMASGIRSGNSVRKNIPQDKNFAIRKDSLDILNQNNQIINQNPLNELNIRQIDSEEEFDSQDNEENQHTNIKIKQDQLFNSQILDSDLLNQGVQEYSQQLIDSVLISSGISSDTSSSQSSKDLENYMKQTQYFIKHLENEEHHENIMKNSVSMKVNIAMRNSMIPQGMRSSVTFQSNKHLSFMRNSEIFSNPQSGMKNHQNSETNKLQEPLEINKEKNNYTDSVQFKSNQIKFNQRYEKEDDQKHLKYEFDKLEDHDLRLIVDVSHHFKIYHPEQNCIQVIAGYNTIHGFNKKRRKIEQIQSIKQLNQGNKQK